MLEAAMPVRTKYWIVQKNTYLCFCLQQVAYSVNFAKDEEIYISYLCFVFAAPILKSLSDFRCRE